MCCNFVISGLIKDYPLNFHQDCSKHCQAELKACVTSMDLMHNLLPLSTRPPPDLTRMHELECCW